MQRKLIASLLLGLVASAAHAHDVKKTRGEPRLYHWCTTIWDAATADGDSFGMCDPVAWWAGQSADESTLCYVPAGKTRHIHVATAALYAEMGGGDEDCSFEVEFDGVVQDDLTFGTGASATGCTDGKLTSGDLETAGDTCIRRSASSIAYEGETTQLVFNGANCTAVTGIQICFHGVDY